MELASLHNNIQTPHLKVIKNTTKQTKKVITKMYINTLVPDFSHINHLGEKTSLKRCALI